jgi:hypothetical protein
MVISGDDVDTLLLLLLLLDTGTGTGSSSRCISDTRRFCCCYTDKTEY